MSQNNTENDVPSPEIQIGDDIFVWICNMVDYDARQLYSFNPIFKIGIARSPQNKCSEEDLKRWGMVGIYKNKKHL